MRVNAKFKNIGKLVRERRERLRYSQTELCVALGFSKNGQNISNVERGLASLPIKHIAKISIVLQTPPTLFKEAILRDYEDQIDKEIWGKPLPWVERTEEIKTVIFKGKHIYEQKHND